jgi:sterol desaturase/sphingolipid hydroxylase (fatty acid hydroxylase superfamily)
MEIFSILSKEIIGFLQLGELISIFRSGELSRLSGRDGLIMLALPLIPILIVIESIVGIIRKNPQTKVYRLNFLIYVFNRVVGQLINLSVAVFVIELLREYALFSTSITWYWFLYAYVVWELGHYFYHFLCHKVRLFWCLHSTHHAPEEMNLSVSYTHFFLEGTFANLIRVATGIILGVDPGLLVLVMTIAPLYGSYIHIDENLVRRGRMGFLGKLILTPSHHRIHHARNPLYLDRNYCNLFNIWDRLFGTYQEEIPSVKLDYGITRQVDSGSFMDVYFGELVALIKDVLAAPTLTTKVLYLLMPPGWSHTGQHQSASILRKKFLNQCRS